MYLVFSTKQSQGAAKVLSVWQPGASVKTRWLFRFRENSVSMKFHVTLSAMKSPAYVPDLLLENCDQMVLCTTNHTQTGFSI